MSLSLLAVLAAVGGLTAAALWSRQCFAAGATISFSEAPSETPGVTGGTSTSRPSEDPEVVAALLASAAAGLVDPSPPDWIASSATEQWCQTHASLRRWALQPASRRWLLAGLDESTYLETSQALDVFERPDEAVDSYNEAWLSEALGDDESWSHPALTGPDAYPRALHTQQARAVLINDDYNLVLAGAGTGKTTTLLRRIAYTVRHRGVPQQQVLALAFNRKAAEQLSDELERDGLGQVKVSTLHALGRELACAARHGDAPPVAPAAQDAHALHSWVQRQLLELVRDASLQGAVQRWFTELSHEVDEPPRTQAEYRRQLRQSDLRTLTGDKVRSRQELYIANWLTLNGVAWEYERRYPHGEATYQPDFYLPEHDLWLEHWGIRRSGEGAPWCDVSAYQKQQHWKRELHTQFGTTLLETWADEIGPDTTDTALRRLMALHGVALKPPAQRQLDHLVAQGHPPIKHLTRLLSTFLSQWRGSPQTLDHARRKARSERDRAFLDLFEPVGTAWLIHLKEHDQTDFSGMVHEGLAAVRSGRVDVPWTELHLDEAQDATELHLQLLEAIAERQPTAHITVVGDDWQSIYGFSGADVQVMTRLASRWPGLQTTRLDQTWRLAPATLISSSRFVQRNPDQLTKELRPKPGREGERVNIRYVGPYEQAQALDDILGQIGRHTPGASVLLMARYNQSLRDPASDRVIQRAKRTGLRVETSTVHRAKGLEADHTVVLDLSDNLMGFPTGMRNDPVLELLRIQPSETYPLAEERRLFYVALTRSRGSAWLLTDKECPSSFVTELLADATLEPHLHVEGEPARPHVCPACGLMTLTERTGPYGVYWACSEPDCDGKASPCRVCEHGPFVQIGTTWSCPECQHTAPVCPGCGAGYLIQRKPAAFGAFVGCSRWQPDNAGCNFTRGGEL